MYLVWLLKSVIYQLIQGNEKILVSDIIYDSRKIMKNCVFICIAGADADGHDYIAAAVENGAIAVIVEKDVEAPPDVTVIRVKSTREALGKMSRAFFCYPEKKMKLIGITGTKGKTTVAYMLKAIFEKAGYRTGLIGTIEVCTDQLHIPAKNTTPESYQLQEYLNVMSDAGCDVVIMEVSSQGLMQQRVAGIMFDYGVFTNISTDHIGQNEHKDFAEYLYWKSQLFNQCRMGILPGADERIQNALSHTACFKQTFGMEAINDLWADHLALYQKCESLGVEFDVHGRLEHHFALNLPGSFNVTNALAAIMAALDFGIEPVDISAALSCTRVNGRCEMLAVSERFCFLLDYAHNGEALGKLLQTLRAYQPERLVCIFGCGGNRSRTRRVEMGYAASRYADQVIITSDNPRYEEPGKIIQDILGGTMPEFENVVVIEDRRAAIRYALSNAREGDLIVLAGKGHETYQEICGKRYDFDEKTVVMQEARSIAGLSIGADENIESNQQLDEF